MSHNLLGQILLHIVRLLAEGYSQREVPITLGVAQGYTRRQQKNFAVQPRCWSATSAEVWRAEESHHKPEKTDSWSEWSGKIVSYWLFVLHIKMICQFQRRLSVWSIVKRLLTAGYWSRHPTRCPRWTSDHRHRPCVWGRTHKWWDLRHWRHCVFSEESRFTLFHSDGYAGVCGRQGERLTECNCGPSVMVWGDIHHGGRSEKFIEFFKMMCTNSWLEEITMLTQCSTYSCSFRNVLHPGGNKLFKMILTIMCIYSCSFSDKILARFHINRKLISHHWQW